MRGGMVSTQTTRFFLRFGCLWYTVGFPLGAAFIRLERQSAARNIREGGLLEGRRPDRVGVLGACRCSVGGMSNERLDGTDTGGDSASEETISSGEEGSEKEGEQRDRWGANEVSDFILRWNTEVSLSDAEGSKFFRLLTALVFETPASETSWNGIFLESLTKLDFIWSWETLLSDTALMSIIGRLKSCLLVVHATIFLLSGHIATSFACPWSLVSEAWDLPALSLASIFLTSTLLLSDSWCKFCLLPALKLDCLADFEEVTWVPEFSFDSNRMVEGRGEVSQRVVWDSFLAAKINKKHQWLQLIERTDRLKTRDSSSTRYSN